MRGMKAALHIDALYTPFGSLPELQSQSSLGSYSENIPCGWSRVVEARGLGSHHLSDSDLDTSMRCRTPAQPVFLAMWISSPTPNGSSSVYFMPIANV